MGSTLEHAVAALSSLAENPANADTIYLGGAIPPIVSVLQDEDGEAETKKHAAATLALLSTTPLDEQEGEVAKGGAADKQKAADSGDKGSGTDEAESPAAGTGVGVGTRAPPWCLAIGS